MFETEFSHMNWVKERLTLPSFALKYIISPMGPLMRPLEATDIGNLALCCSPSRLREKNIHVCSLTGNHNILTIT